MDAFDKAVAAAKNLASDTGENPEYDRALAELIVDTVSPPDIEDWATWDHDDQKDYVLTLITAKLDGSKNTLFSLQNPRVGYISITPTGSNDPDAQWRVHVPATREKMFDGYDPEIIQPPDEVPWTYEAAVLHPWGDTYWATLEGAISFLSLLRKQGNIKYNDGRTAQ